MITRRKFLVGASALTAAALSSACRSRSPSSQRSLRSTAALEPIGLLRSSWGTDPLSLGSYSYLAVGSSHADREALAQPIGDYLYFAGEATSIDYPGTVHGALLSGRRAADEVMAAISAPGSVVVVGAGAAGTAAATVLAAAGYEVVIHEASSRAGGRIYTSDALGVPLDLGASWIHGVEGNPVAQLAYDYDITTTETDYDDVRAYVNGEPADVDRADALLSELASETGDVAEAEMSVLQAIDATGYLDDLTAYEKELVQLGVTTTIEHEYATDVAMLNVAAVDEGREFDGEDVQLVGGYSQLIEAAVDDLSDAVVINYNSSLLSVVGRAGSVTLEFSDSTIEARAAILTVPLGVLKSGAIEFVGGLDVLRTDAIGRLGFGLLDKLYLRFDEVFWDDVEIIDIAGPDNGLWSEWINMEPTIGEPILCGFNAGSAAFTVAAMSDAEAVASAMNTLHSAYG